MAAAVQGSPPPAHDIASTIAPAADLAESIGAHTNHEMLIANGLKLHGGAALGQALVVRQPCLKPSKECPTGQGKEIELARVKHALELAAQDLESNVEDFRDNQELADIFRANSVMARDTSHLKAIGAVLDSVNTTAEEALKLHFCKTIEKFEALVAPKFAALALDVKEILKLALTKLGGEELDVFAPKPGATVVIAESLAPFEINKLVKARDISALVLANCGKTSHTSLVAKSLHIPVVRGIDATPLVRNGDTVYVNGDSGEICINPDPASLRSFTGYIKNRSVQGSGIKLTERSPASADEKPWIIRATIGAQENLTEMVAAGFKGVGLFRTEELFLGDEGVISEDAQLAIYSKVLAASPNQSVTIRTFDLGADKWSPKLGKPQGDNAKLGKRGIRLCFAEMIDDFRTQARAIYRAQASHGNARVMFPVVNDLGEFRQAKALFLEERTKLIAEGLIEESLDLKFGAMIETPSAVLMVKTIITEADFLSIGSNDLTQYILATDREATVDSAHEPVEHHPAVIKSLHRIAKAARSAGKPLSICGDMAGDTLYTPILVGLGITELSVISADAPKVNFALSCLDTPRCKALTKELRKTATADESLRMIQSFLATITEEQDRIRAGEGK